MISFQSPETLQEVARDIELGEVAVCHWISRDLSDIVTVLCYTLVWKSKFWQSWSVVEETKSRIWTKKKMGIIGCFGTPHRWTPSSSCSVSSCNLSCNLDINSASVSLPLSALGPCSPGAFPADAVERLVLLPFTNWLSLSVMAISGALFSTSASGHLMPLFSTSARSKAILSFIRPMTIRFLSGLVNTIQDRGP